MIRDNTINGSCSNCGECCTTCATVSAIEVDTIKQYIIDNNIEQLIYRRDGRLENVCPFRDRVNKKCNIYEVRPEICRLFICNLDSSGLTSETLNRIRLTALYNISPREHKSFHEIFYDDVNWQLDYKNQTIKIIK